MPVMHSGKHICEKCGYEFTWVDYEPFRSTLENIRVEKIPNEPKIHLKEYMDTCHVKMFINCPKCDEYLSFVYNTTTTG